MNSSIWPVSFHVFDDALWYRVDVRFGNCAYKDMQSFTFDARFDDLDQLTPGTLFKERATPAEAEDLVAFVQYAVKRAWKLLKQMKDQR